MPVTLPVDESWLVGNAQVFDVVYIWQNGRWVLDSSREPMKVIPTEQLDDRPFDNRQKYPGERGYVPIYVARYYWAKPGRWVSFGSHQNF